MLPAVGLLPHRLLLGMQLIWWGTWPWCASWLRRAASHSTFASSATNAGDHFVSFQHSARPSRHPPTHLQADMEDFAAVNAIYGRFFPQNPPARATFAVKGLPLGAKVEIEATALL